LPVAAIVAGAGTMEGLRRLEPLLRGHGSRLWPAAVAFAALLFLANAAYAARRFETRDRAIDSELWLKKKATGERVKVLTSPGSLLLVVDTAMDRQTPETSMTPPDVFYFGDRRGWYLSAAWLTPEKIENIRREGALYFVVSGQSTSDFKEERADIFDYLSARYRKIMDDEDGIIFDLGARE
jgi:hypothetical protein